MATQCGDVGSLSVDEYHSLCASVGWAQEHCSSYDGKVVCPRCECDDTQKIAMPPTSYVRGYGYVDKNGAKNDMDRHLMVTGQDPYAEHRRSGDTGKIIKKLNEKTKYNSRPKDIFIK